MRLVKKVSLEGACLPQNGSHHPSLCGAEKPPASRSRLKGAGAQAWEAGLSAGATALRGEWGEGRQRGASSRCSQPRLSPLPNPAPQAAGFNSGSTQEQARSLRGAAADADDAGAVGLSILLVLGLKTRLGGTEFSETLQAETQCPLCRGLRQ